MPLATVTDELTTKLATTGIGWDKTRWDRFVTSLTPEEQQLEVQMMLDAAAPPSTDAWNVVLTILQDVLVVAAGVTGIAGAISAVRMATS